MDDNRAVRSLVSAFLTAWMLAATAPAGEAPQEIKLEYEVGGKVSTIFTPNKLVQRGKAFHFSSPSGKINIAGQEVDVAGRFTNVAMLAVDCNADHKASAAEWVALDLRSSSGSFRLKLPDGATTRDYAIRFVGVRMSLTLNRPTNLSGRYMIDCCMSGTFDGEPIRIFDDNLDGTFTQDGHDAIAIGSSVAAVPLRQFHQIGDGHYSIDVAADGKTITFRRAENLELGLVATPVSSSILACLVLTDDSKYGRSYDVKTVGRAGIPAGTYKLVYGVLAGGGRMVVAEPTKESLTYTIEPKKLNILKFGLPARLEFSARYYTQEIRIGVATDLRFYGIGGERLNLDFAGRRPYGDPLVTILNGPTRVASGFMGYDDEDRLVSYSEWIPLGVSRKQCRIIVSSNIPLLGQTSGVRTLEEIIDDERPKPVKAEGPAVVTRPIPAGIELGKASLRPRPKVEPVASVTPKPEPVKPVAPPPPPPEPREPPKPHTIDPEAQAETLFGMAKAFVLQGMQAQGKAKYQEVVAKYPTSDAAKRAKEILFEMEIEQEIEAEKNK